MPRGPRAPAPLTPGIAYVKTNTKPLEFEEMRAAILWALGATGAQNPRWLAVNNRPMVRSVHVLALPGTGANRAFSSGLLVFARKKRIRAISAHAARGTTPSTAHR